MKNSKISPFNLASSLLSTTVRMGVGINSHPGALKPEITLKLYDMEGCPYCRLVREALTELDLDVEIYPCPKSGQRFRAEVIEQGGKAQFPYLVDANTGVAMYESMEIVTYLFATYANQSLPLKWQFGALHTLGSSLVGFARQGRGLHKRPSLPPAELLVLYSFESSPYARFVRETLCELEIPYLVRNCGRTQLSEWLLPQVRSALNIQPQSQLHNRQELQQRTGRMAIPYLIDPNNQTEMFESADIVEYLETTYGSVA
jgi:glutathione S-transferase